MGLGRRVMTLFERRGPRSVPSQPADAGPTGPGRDEVVEQPRPTHTIDRHGVRESTLEAMFAYQDELSRPVPRQRRGAGRH